ncbi:MAG: cation diffusion facilitator family transporter [Paludibacter sp.]|nr:cation diffusion facilitator family transporter [Paludibacter sp.]
MQKEKRRVAFLSVIAAIFITGFKLIIGILTGSLGILSEALHSALDMVAAVITYFSVKVSDKPADKEHNYGHGKVENLSALIETILLLVTCVWIIYEATHRLLTGQTKIEVSVWSYVVVISSIIIDFSRSRALSRVAKKYNSQALEADALHFSTDIWSSSVVLFGLIAYQFFGWYAADSIAALFVAVIVLYVSYQLGRKAIDVLLDKAPVNTKKIVHDILITYPEIKKYHGLKARTAGADTFIKFNVHFDPDLSLREVHEVCDKIESEIQSRVERSEVYIHAEPEDAHHLENDSTDIQQETF